jgi:hypothetical protein
MKKPARLSPALLSRMVAQLKSGDRLTVSNRPAARELARACEASTGKAPVVKHLKRGLWLVG